MILLTHGMMRFAQTATTKTWAAIPDSGVHRSLLNG